MLPNADTLVHRMRHLMNTGEGADVHFWVGRGDEKELISAHKLILKTASGIFDKMFSTNTVNEKSEDATWEVISSVEVTDIDVETFKTMLRFIYTNECCGLNEHNAMEVLYAAKKYQIAGLINACVMSISICKLSNVFDALLSARSLGVNDFVLRCLAYIDRNAETLIKTDKFLQIDQNLLVELLGRDQLRICGEIALWKAALCWADGKCRQNGMECSGPNRRAMLGPALHKIRFPLIPMADFADSVAPSDVLTKEEMLSVFLFLANPRGGVSALFPLPLPFHRRTLISKATIEWKIEKVSEFANIDEQFELRKGENALIRGMAFRIDASISDFGCQKILFFDLDCDYKEMNDHKWTSFYSASFRILSQKEGKKDLVGEEIYGQFGPKTYSLPDCFCMVSFKKLMDPTNGWYDEENDSVTVVSEVIVDEENREEEEKENKGSES
ncbi:hypothetical protein niasHT_030313 [Heterodera trifolii]|uniref:BTB domain-containing protein n=1 Tax=Heterodera trifolii TaxID=157864 RepID=A0ABD2KS82_9BILA